MVQNKVCGKSYLDVLEATGCCATRYGDALLAEESRRGHRIVSLLDGAADGVLDAFNGATEPTSA